MSVVGSAAKTGAKRIAMWSGPRNVSTAMMRSWEHRADTEVIDEPLYAFYLDQTGSDHPGREAIIEAGPSDLTEAIRRCLDAPGPGASISYQKHLATHLLPSVPDDWLDALTHGLLLRDPRRVIASYTKVRSTVTLEDLGLPQQVTLADRCSVIIDSADFLTDPESYSRLVCDAVGVDFDPAMLSWPAGSRPSDGVWAPHWYRTVEASTGFAPPPSGSPPAIPDHLRGVTDEAMDIFTELRRRRSVV